MKVLVKIFCILSILCILAPLVSADWEWDNVGDYDSEDSTMTIENSFGLPMFGSTIAKVTLLSDSHVYVVPGANREVARFRIESFIDYSEEGVFKQLEFYDLMNENNKFSRNFDYKLLTYRDKEVPNYVTTCIKNITGEFCTAKQEGTNTIKEEVWNNFDETKGVSFGNLTIGVFTTVMPNDYIDWVPTLFGVKINEWAVWQSSFEEGLKVFYTLNESTGATATEATKSMDVNMSMNLSNMENGDWVGGLIGNALLFDNADDEEARSNNNLSIIGHDNRTACGWYNITDGNHLHTLVSYGRPSNNNGFALALDSTNDRVYFSGFNNEHTSSAGTASVYNDWGFVCALINSTGLGLFHNGTLVYAATNAAIDTLDNKTVIGKNGNALSWPLDGAADEVAIWNRTLTQSEITDLYNDGDGLTFGVLDLEVALNAPINFFNTSNSEIEFNCSSSSQTTNVQNLSLFINDVINTTKVSGVASTLELNVTIDNSEGSHNWSCRTSDINGGQTVSGTRFFIVDSTSPIINITHPPEFLDFQLLDNNLTINWTVEDLVLENNCILEYKKVNVTIPCLDNNRSINITDFINKTITLCANDSFGNGNCSSRTWDYYVFEHNQTFNNDTTEGNTENFLANLQTSFSITQSEFFYNITESIGENFASGDRTILRKNNFIVPNVTADTEVPFYWQLTFSDDNKVNLSLKNHTVFNLGLDNCTTNTNVLLNFTLVDEELQTVLDNNATIEIAVNIFGQDRSEIVINLSDSYNVNQTKICLNRNLENASIYSLDTIVRYEHPLYANEYYNIVNLSLTINTSIQDIFLFDLNISDSTEFQLTFTGTDFLPVEDALVFVDRQYISENIFKTVELPRTDSNGQTILHLVRNDVIYNFIVSKNGEILGNFQNVIAFCEDFTIGKCTLNLNALSNASEIFDYSAEIGITLTSPPTYNATANSVSFSFTSVDGSVKNVFMNVTRKDIFGNATLCENTVQSSSGTVTCTISEELSETIIFTTISVDGENWVIDSSTIVDSTAYGSAGYVIWFLLTMALIFAFGSSKNGVMIGLIISYIGAVALGITLGGITGIGSSGIWMILITMVAIWQINRNRKI